MVLRSYYLPVGLSYRAYHDALKNRGFVIYEGQGKLSERIFRVSTMGQIDHDDLDRFVQVVSNLLMDSSRAQ